MLLLGLNLLGLLLRLHRLERLLRRKLASFGDDERPDFDRHVLEELDGHLVAADPLDRVAADLAPVDAHLVFLPELVGDVGRRDRPEQRAGRAGLDVEAELQLSKTLRDRLGVLEGFRLVLRTPPFDLLNLRHTRGRRLVGEAARKQEVPCVAPRDVHDLAAQANLVEVLAEDDLHQKLDNIADRGTTNDLPRRREAVPSRARV